MRPKPRSGARPQTLLLALGLLWVGREAAAHPLAPSLLELTEEAPGRVAVHWRQPLQLPAGTRLEPLLPARCRPAGPPLETQDSQALQRQWRVDCGARGLGGARIEVSGLAWAGSDALLRVALLDGGRVQTILRPDAPSYTLPSAPQGRAEVGAAYLRLGVEHLLTGWDHLAFVLGLVLLVAGRRRLVATITAFTLGHSITLSLAALNIVTPPARVIEPAIALSIVFVGTDNLLRGSGRDLRAWAALAFGLIHGFGFANVLREFGLPGEALGWSLFSFNVGVEIGQLAIVVVVATLLELLRRRSHALGHRVAYAGSVLVIAAGTYWFVQRLFFPGV